MGTTDGHYAHIYIHTSRIFGQLHVTLTRDVADDAGVSLDKGAASCAHSCEIDVVC